MVKKNFLLLSLDDEKTKAIANTVASSSCKKILDILADGDATESGISEKLKMPISTVHYNLKQLFDARLIEVESSTYSEKGKEVKHYTLANKYIIIAPKGADKQSFLEAVKSILPVFSFGLLGAYFVNMVSQNAHHESQLIGGNVRSLPMDSAVMESSAMAKESVQTIMYDSVAPNSAGISTSLFDVIMNFQPWEWFLFGFTFALFCIWLSSKIKEKFFNKKNTELI